MTPLRTLAVAAGLAAALPLHAAEFNAIEAGRSSLAFTFKQMNVPVDGSFRRFTAQLAFDPARPQAARAGIDIDLASIDAGSAEANDAVLGKEWFNVKAYPTARFVSTAVRALGGDRFELAGKLTIKGRTRDAVAPFTFRQQGGQGVFDGTLTIRRADFAIGEGDWADFGTVANEVPIRFHIVAASAAVRK